MPWKRRRSWTEDTFCRQDADHSFTGLSEQGIDLPWMPVPNNAIEVTTCSTQTRCRSNRVFLLQLLIFAHCLYLHQPCLPTVQSGLAFSERDCRDCRLRLCHSADPGDCQHSNVQQRRAEQLRGAPVGAPDPAGFGGPTRQLSVGPKGQRSRRRRRAVLAAFLATRTSFCPLPAPASSIHPRKFVDHGGLALSLRGVAGVECDILPIQILANN